MRSKVIYTKTEVEEIVGLINEKLTSNTIRQKGIRNKIRKHGFYASEFGLREGYNVADFLSVVSVEGQSKSTTLQKPGFTQPNKKILSHKIAKRAESDEHYVIDLCDEILNLKALRQHRFDFLRGDSGVKLPVDAYYLDLKLVIEYREKQHTETVAFFDKKQTISGMSRGEQRKHYDELRRVVLPLHGLRLIEIGYDELAHTKSKKLVRDREKDIKAIKRKIYIKK